MKFYARTDIGKARKDNEDSLFIPENTEGFFAVVADGMGGHNAGEVASRIVVETLENVLSTISPDNLNENDIRNAIIKANENVFSESHKNTGLKGMGSTVTAAAFINDEAIIANVGDSRAYIFRDGILTQITKDHSYVQMMMDNGHMSKEEAENHPYRNIITRAIGTEEHIEIDIYKTEFTFEDAMLLCSDGLSAVVSDEDIARILMTGIENAADRLVNTALLNGGTDNISVIIACRGGEGA